MLKKRHGKRGDIMRYRETFGHIHYFTKELALQVK